MRLCPSCQYPNREGTIFCIDCGLSLRDAKSAHLSDLTQMQRVEVEKTATNTITQIVVAPSRINHLSMMLEDEVIFSFTLDKFDDRVLMGRADSSSNVQPKIDFSAYGAMEYGVSRHHAWLQVVNRQLVCFDNDSSNGTFINGVRLMPQQPYVIESGDQLCLGYLIVDISHPL